MSIFKILFCIPEGNDIDIYREMVLLPKTTFNIITEKMKNLDDILFLRETET